MNADRLFRQLLIAAALTAVLFSIPLAITLFPGELQRLLHGAGDFGLTCASALYWVGAQLPPFGVIVLALSVISAGMAAVKVASTLTRTGLLLQRARIRDPLPDRLARAAARVGTGNRVLCLDDARSYAYTAGLLRPQIRISFGLVRRLRQRELAAVLAHELSHVRRRDPLRLLSARTVQAALFAAPWIADLVGRFEVTIELDADRAAMRSSGRAALASAMWKLSRGGSRFDPAEAAIGAWSLSHARIEQLAGMSVAELPPAASRRVRALSAVSVAVALVLLLGQAARANLAPASALDHLVPGVASQVHLCPTPISGVLL